MYTERNLHNSGHHCALGLYQTVIIVRVSDMIKLDSDSWIMEWIWTVD